MEEQRARQEDEAKKVTSAPETPAQTTDSAGKFLSCH